MHAITLFYLLVYFLNLCSLFSFPSASNKFILYSCAVSIYSLFPLLYEAQEYPIKVVLLLLHVALMWFGFSSQFFETSESDERTVTVSKNGGLVTRWLEKVYLIGFVGVEVWGQFLHPLILGDRLPFLPLMLISFYCALGMMYSWIWQLRCIIRSC